MSGFIVLSKPQQRTAITAQRMDHILCAWGQWCRVWARTLSICNMGCKKKGHAAFHCPARAGVEPQELRALMSQMEMGEVAVAGQAVALAHWHAARTGPCSVAYDGCLGSAGLYAAPCSAFSLALCADIRR